MLLEEDAEQETLWVISRGGVLKVLIILLTTSLLKMTHFINHFLVIIHNFIVFFNTFTNPKDRLQYLYFIGTTLERGWSVLPM